MPSILNRLSEDEQSAAIESLLTFFHEDVPEPKLVANGLKPVPDQFWLKGNSERGQVLYHQIGCIACHAIDDQYRPKEKTSADIERKLASLNLDAEELQELGLALPREVEPIPHADLKTKFHHRSLSMFLLQPSLVHPAERMPNFALTPMESADIATYLLGAHRVDVDRLRQSENRTIKEGRDGVEWYGRLGCANCHPDSRVPSTSHKALKDLNLSADNSNCLASIGATPRYTLSLRQIEAIKSAIGKRRDQGSVFPAGKSPLQLLQLNCYACHQREGLGGLGPSQWSYFENVLHVDLGDEGRFPPALDRVGAKLQRSWLEKVISGTAPVRPYLRARMPGFSETAKSIASALESLDSSETKKVDRSRPSNVVEMDAGRRIINGGCLQCHAFRGDSLPGVMGIDISQLQQRLRPDWFVKFLLDPASLKKNTRMPSFFPNGKSSLPELLDGDVQRQIQSVWDYVNDPQQLVPEKLEQHRSDQYEVVPTDRAVLLRSFMKPEWGGVNGIFVGFPEPATPVNVDGEGTNARSLALRVCLAIDADNGRLVALWKGRFVNAYDTWFNRFAPPLEPLGDNLVLAPRDSVQIEGLAEARIILQGYRLNQRGIPTFLYTCAGIEFTDHYEPDGQGGLLRHVVIRQVAEVQPSPRVRMVLADSMEKTVQRGRFRAEGGLEISMSGMGWFSEISDRQLSAMSGPGAGELRVRYHW